MRKTLTPEEVKRLQPYEEYFGTAIRVGYARNPGRQAIGLMLNIWEALTGNNYPFSPSCGTCIMNLLRDMGTLYFAASGRTPEDAAPSKVVTLHANVESEPAKVESSAEKTPAAPQPGNTTKKAQNAKKTTKTAKK